MKKETKNIVGDVPKGYWEKILEQIKKQLEKS